MSQDRFKKELDVDMARLSDRLKSLCGGRLPKGEANRLRILDLACGECFEAETLAQVVRSLDPAKDDLQIDFVGMDIRAREIARAQERCRGKLSGVDFRFIEKDGRQLLRERALEKEVDLVFVRHQNFYLGGDEWQGLFERSLEKLAPDGRLIITSYFDEEHELAKAAIERVGGELLSDVINEEARRLPTPGKYVDKRLAMFRRKLS